MKNQFFSFLLISILLISILPGPGRAEEFERFNVRVGTQTFDPNYAFDSSKTMLVETADRIHEMGSDIIKFGLYYRIYSTFGLPDNPAITTLTEMARDEPSVRTVLDMPFRYYFLWAHPLTTPGLSFSSYWRNDGLSAIEAATEYDEIRDLAEYLLQTYNGSGKTFFLGHWEGDWAIRGHTVWDDSPTDTAIQGMIDWYNNRQQAIEDARAAISHNGVEVYQYAEVNLITRPRLNDPSVKTVTSDVLPSATVDLVSYSAWDSVSILNPSLQSLDELIESMDFIEANAILTGPFQKNVFIGEYGLTAGPAGMGTPAQQAQTSTDVFKKTSAWGSPFILYWQIYSNGEIDGQDRGFWLIDENNQEVPAWDVHQDFLGKAHVFKNLYRFWLNRNPDEQAFNNFSATFDTFQMTTRMDAFLDSAEYQSKVSNLEFVNFLFLNLLGESSPSGTEYDGYISNLNSGGSRVDVLNSILNSLIYEIYVPNSVFVNRLLTNTLQRNTANPNSVEFQQLLSRLEGGENRSDLWREILDDAEFYDAELGIRGIDTKDSEIVFEKYFPPTLGGQSSFYGWEIYFYK